MELASSIGPNDEKSFLFKLQFTSISATGEKIVEDDEAAAIGLYVH